MTPDPEDAIDDATASVAKAITTMETSVRVSHRWMLVLMLFGLLLFVTFWVVRASDISDIRDHSADERKTNQSQNDAIIHLQRELMESRRSFMEELRQLREESQRAVFLLNRETNEIRRKVEEGK